MIGDLDARAMREAEDDEQAAMIAPLTGRVAMAEADIKAIAFAVNLLFRRLYGVDHEEMIGILRRDGR